MASKKKLFEVRNGRLYDPSGLPVCEVRIIDGKRTAWYDWLESHRSFRFVGRDGIGINVIKERRWSRSGNDWRMYDGYWYGSKKNQGELRRLYLGKSERLTRSALERATGKLAQTRIEELINE